MDSPNRSTEPQREALYARRRDAIISSIYELFLSVDDPNQISVLDVFNRLMLLLQSACMFVLVKYDQKTGTIIHDQNGYKIFNPHPLHQQKIRDAIKDADEGDFIAIFGSKKYRLLVLLANQDHKASKDGGYNFEPIDKFDQEQTKNVLDEKTYQERFGPDLLEALKQIVDECKGLVSANTRKSKVNVDYGEIEDIYDYKYWHKFFIKGLESRQHGYDLPDDGVIDKAYKKSRSSLAYQYSQQSKPELANFLFFLRDYSDDNLRRAGYYDFGLRILLCSVQERDIRDFLIELKRQDNLKFWYSNLITDKDNPYFNIGKEANKRFWEILISIEKEKEEERRKKECPNSNDGCPNLNKLIDIIKKPLGKNSYSMAEPTFLSGIIHFRNPSVNAGLHRCIPDSQIEKGYYGLDKDEILRVVIVHYLLLGMAHSFDELKKNSYDEKNFSAMLAPISIGGRILGVLSYVTEKSKDKDSTANIAELSSPWRKNFHIYTATHKRIKRHLRTYFWQFYVAMVFLMYYKTILDVENTKGDYEDIENILNIRLSYIDRFFSYNSINCKIKEEDSRVRDLFPNKKLPTWGRISSDRIIDFSVGEAGRFSFYQGVDQSKLSRFVDLSEIAIKISNAYHGIHSVSKRYMGLK